MCESCSTNLNRREFVVGGSLAASLLSATLLRAAEGTEDETGGATTREKTPASVKVVFLYPLPEVVDQGKAEASWQEHRWHPYPGRYFSHAEQQKKFTEHIRAMGERIGMRIDAAPKPLTTEAETDRYIAESGSSPRDVTLIICLSSASIGNAHRISQQVDGPAIVYLPTGASHGPPPGLPRFGFA